MPVEAFAEWLKRQGHHVIRTASSWWYDAAPRVYQAFPYHWVIEPDETELTDFFKRTKGIALRYSAPITAQTGQIGYHVVYPGREYTLDQLPQKARYDVRKGMKYAGVEPITFPRLAEEGWRLRAETLVRQGRIKAESEEWWHRLCKGAEELPGFESWAAVHDGQLVASLISHTCGSCCSILYQQSSTEHLKYGVNNALTYVFTSEILSRPGITCVFYGLSSLDAPESVDEYKFRMDYQAKAIRQRVMFHPLISPFVRPITYYILNNVNGLKPGSALVSKASGMIRAYIEGKRPLEYQVWPKCVTGRRDAEKEPTPKHTKSTKK